MAGECAQDTSAGSPPSGSGIYRSVRAGERLFQGELVERILEWIPKYDTTQPDQVVGVEPRLQKLLVILTQDCDLARDWNMRRAEPRVVTDLRSVLVCPACPADELRESQNLTNKKWEVVRQNKDERYAYLAEIPREVDAACEGHAALLLDLTNYFTVRTVELYRQLQITGPDAPRRRCVLETPWREHLQCRFAAYQARIGLPRDHFVPESRRSESPHQR